MTKHPNAPAEDRAKRQKQIPVTLEEYDKIHELWEKGMKKCDISILMDRTSGAIAHCLTRLTRETVVRREARRAKRTASTYKYAYIELEEKDLSSLPDTELFEHSKDYIL